MMIHQLKKATTTRRGSERNDTLEETFVDASAYEELINKGWEEMKANRSVELDSEELGAPAAPPRRVFE